MLTNREIKTTEMEIAKLKNRTDDLVLFLQQHGLTHTAHALSAASDLFGFAEKNFRTEYENKRVAETSRARMGSVLPR
jgi:hypothetical protein